MTVFIAVITHKAVMAFSLGLNIAQSDLSVKAFVWSNVLFSLSSPVGVAIGGRVPPSLLFSKSYFNFQALPFLICRHPFPRKSAMGCYRFVP